MISPTPGRVVWYFPRGESGAFCSAGADVPHAAMVARVWSDRMVNLAVFDANGVQHARTSVRLLQDDDPIPETGTYAAWMPYQKGQAAKTEQAEKALTPAG